MRCVQCHRLEATEKAIVETGADSKTEEECGVEWCEEEHDDN